MNKKLIVMLVAGTLGASFLTANAANTTAKEKLNEAGNKIKTDYGIAKQKIDAKYKQDKPIVKQKFDRAGAKIKQDYESAKQKWNDSNTKSDLDSAGDKTKQKWNEETPKVKAEWNKAKQQIKKATN